MHPNGTHIHYYFVCWRKLWLFANGISMEHTSEVVADGKLLHETSYPQRADKYTEISIDGVKIDFYDAKNKVIHETKRSNSVEKAHEWQLKYYIYVLKKNGIDGVTGILEYPKLRITEEMVLSDEDIAYIEGIIPEIESIMIATTCPPRIKKGLCKSCAYFDFCWIEE